MVPTEEDSRDTKGKPRADNKQKRAKD